MYKFLPFIVVLTGLKPWETKLSKISSILFSIISILNIIPALALITLCEYISTLFVLIYILSSPTATAVLIIVPRFPGSDMFSNTIFTPLFSHSCSSLILCFFAFITSKLFSLIFTLSIIPSGFASFVILLYTFSFNM